MLTIGDGVVQSLGGNKCTHNDANLEGKPVNSHFSVLQLIFRLIILLNTRWKLY